jgi:hypothetical protein
MRPEYYIQIICMVATLPTFYKIKKSLIGTKWLLVYNYWQATG